jgi:hypothetical protein
LFRLSCSFGKNEHLIFIERIKTLSTGFLKNIRRRPGSRGGGPVADAVSSIAHGVPFANRGHVIM